MASRRRQVRFTRCIFNAWKERKHRPTKCSWEQYIFIGLEFNRHRATAPLPTPCGHLGRVPVVRRTANDQENNLASTLQWDIGTSGVKSSLATLFCPIITPLMLLSCFRGNRCSEIILENAEMMCVCVHEIQFLENIFVAKKAKSGYYDTEREREGERNLHFRRNQCETKGMETVQSLR